MSKDIRSFFKKANGNSTKKSNDVVSLKSESKKRVYNVIDSDEDDDLVMIPSAKKQKDSSSKKKEKNQPKESPVKKKNEAAKPVNLETFFGKSPVSQKPQTTIKPSVKKETVKDVSKKSNKSRNERKKKKSTDNMWLENHSDEEFEATLLQLDEKELEGLGVIQESPSKSLEKASREAVSKVASKSPEKAPEDAKYHIKITPSKPKKEMDVTKQTRVKTESTTPKTKGTPSEFDSEKKRKTNAEAYQKFLVRGGARNPGCKIIPKGNGCCLSGKTFVVTGVLESMEREEAAELIKRCGGRVTSSVSKKTNYIVIGDEPGESKLEKARKFKTPELTEDQLLELIREKSGETIVESESSEDVIAESPKEETSKYFEDNTIKRKREEDKEGLKKHKITHSGGGFFGSELEGSSKMAAAKASSHGLKKEKSEGSSKSKRVVSEANFYSLAKKMKCVPASMDSSSSGLGSSLGSEDVKHSSTDDGTISIDLGDSLWVDKHKPKNTKNIIGQTGEKSNVKKLTKWLANWHINQAKRGKKGGRPAPWNQGDDGAYFKAALLSGAPGVGKTTTVQLVCKELGLDTIEFNASDTRSKKLLQQEVSELLSTRSIRGYMDSSVAKHVLVMDEVDGMAGNEDRGGVQELIQLIKDAKIPVVCMCNDRSHPKMRSLVNYCFDLRFNRPRVEQIKGAMMSVCYKEGIKISPDALQEIIVNSHQDVRQVLHNLSMWVVKDRGLSKEQAKLDAEKAKKHLKLGPWDVARQVFSASDHANMTLRDKEDLFFQDYSLGPLFVQDTYLRAKPHKAKNDKRKTLTLLAEAADSIAWGDVCEKQIRSQNAWGLLPTQAILSSVLPGYIMEGHVQGQIQFPVWLGKNSKKNRMDRLLQDLQVHMRLSMTGSKQSVNLDYLQYLRDAIVRPLVEEGASGVPQALQLLQDYNLCREDLDSLVELSQWPGTKDPMADVESKVKAALTRAYNKEGKLNPYAAAAPVKKAAASSADTGEFYEEEEEQQLSEKEEDDVTSDAMIKKGKQKKEKVQPSEPSTSKAKKEVKEKSSGKNKGKGKK